MITKATFMRRVNWLLVSGFVFLLPELYLKATSPPENEVPLPMPGKTAVFEVVNKGVSAMFHDKFVLGYDTDVTPSLSVGMPDRPPVACRFRITNKQSGIVISTIEQLDYAAESWAGKTATFASEPFAMPVGRNTVALTNLGCHKGDVFTEGSAGIGPIGEHLLVPVGAVMLKFVGFLLIALGLILNFTRRLKARTGVAIEVVANVR